MSARYGFVIDLDRCTGCGACMVACAAENNVPPANPRATPRTGLTPMLVRKVSNGMEGAARREAFIPIACMHCGNETPCVARLSATSRGSGSGYRHRGADAAALPGLQILHDRLSLPCPLLQLVGSCLASGHGEKPQSGGCRSDARRRREVQHVPRAFAQRQGKSRGSREGKKSIRQTTSPPARKRVQPGPSCSGIWQTKMIPSLPPRILPTLFDFWRGSARNPRFITNPSKLG